jgi:ribosomal protein S15P/S13E
MKNHKKENKKLGKIQNGLYYLEGGLIRIIKYPRRDTKLKSRKNSHIM